MADDVKFIRVRGRVVPIKNKKSNLDLRPQIAKGLIGGAAIAAGEDLYASSHVKRHIGPKLIKKKFVISDWGAKSIQNFKKEKPIVDFLNKSVAKINFAHKKIISNAGRAIAGRIVMGVGVGLAASSIIGAAVKIGNRRKK